MTGPRENICKVASLLGPVVQRRLQFVEHQAGGKAASEAPVSTVAAEGWTKTALDKMWKLDSLLREGLRVNGIGISTCSGFLTTRAEHSPLPPSPPSFSPVSLSPHAPQRL